MNPYEFTPNSTKKISPIGSKHEFFQKYQKVQGHKQSKGYKEQEEEEEENDILAKLNKLRSQQYDIPPPEHNSRKIVPASPPNAEYTSTQAS